MTRSINRDSATKRSVVRQAGLTLVELMVTVAMTFILLAMIVPSYQRLSQNNIAATEVNDFAAFLQLAREEARKRNNTVNVVSTSPSASDEWGGGAQMKDASTSAVISVLEALPGGLTLDSSSSVTTMSFTKKGYLSPTPGGTFTLCGGTGEKGRTFTINAVGRLETQTITCS